MVSARVGIRSCADRALDSTSLLAPRLIVRPHGVTPRQRHVYPLPRAAEDGVGMRRKKKDGKEKSAAVCMQAVSRRASVCVALATGRVRWSRCSRVMTGRWHPRGDCVARRLRSRRFRAVCTHTPQPHTHRCCTACTPQPVADLYARALCGDLTFHGGGVWCAWVCWKGGAVHGRGTGDTCVLDRRLERTFRSPGLAGRSGRSASWPVPWSAQVTPQVSVGGCIHACVA